VAATYDLTRVKGLVRPPPGAPEPWFNNPKSVDVVSDRLGIRLDEAQEFICARIEQLTPDDYCPMPPRPPSVRPKVHPADVYGIETQYGIRPQKVGWYVKLEAPGYVRLNVLSFHPPTAPLHTVGGLTIRRS